MALNPVQRNYDKYNQNAPYRSEFINNTTPGITEYRAAIIRESALSGFFLILFSLLAWLVSSKATETLDTNTMVWAATTVNPISDRLLSLLTTIGGYGGVSVMAVLLGVFFLWQRQIRNMILLTFSVGGGILLDSILKVIFRRIRPDNLTESAHLTSFSFPSGHAVASACFFGFLLWLSFQFNWRPVFRTIWAITLLLIILLVGVSRIYLVEHYLSDVTGGFLFAAFWLIAVLGVGYKSFQLWQIRRLGQAASVK